MLNLIINSLENITASVLHKLIEIHDGLENEPNQKKAEKKITDMAIDGNFMLMSKSFNFPISFENCSFNFVYIDDITWHNTIKFEYCKFSEDFNIKSLEASSLRFENCQFEKSVNIDNCKIHILDFEKTESHSGINFTGGEIFKIMIDPVNEKTHFSFVGKFLLIKELSIKSVSGITIFSKKCIINLISLTGYYNISSRLDFNNIINQKIKLNELNNDGKIYFSNIKPVAVHSFKDKPVSDYINLFRNTDKNKHNNLEIELIDTLEDNFSVINLILEKYPFFSFIDFIEDNYYVDFLEYQPFVKAKFDINNSSVGILELKNIMFEQYELEIKSSDLSAIKLINSKIPDVKVNDDYLNYYSVYNDLYTSAGKQNNTKDKVDYYKTSQRYLYRYLDQEAPPNARDLGSRCAIKISWLFSNHGTNWLQAVLVTIAITFVCFCLFIDSLNEMNLDLSSKGFSNFGTIMVRFFPQFLNPLHKIDFMQEVSKIGLYSVLIDFFARIIISIGVFEIIRSFRKHVRQ